ncbi:MAG: glycosyltransferase family 4 protein [Lachnospiraceae bacterium]|nr:glycosyltransferase family 4 protein [Lachnospiraceae bacterium]
MKDGEKIKVLMIGPDRSVHGGISGVVNNLYEAGLAEKVDLTYIGTMVDGSKIRKLLKAAGAYVRFCVRLPRIQIVHVNMASDVSYYRKSIFIRTAYRFHKKIIIHQHGGDFETFYDKELNPKLRKKVDRVLNMGDVFLVLAPIWKDFFSHMVDAGKIVVFPDGIFIPKPFEKQYGQRKILFLGRLCKEKGLWELLQTMPALKEQYPDVKVYFGGIWEDEELKKAIGKYGDTVEWLGWISGEEKQKYLRECDIFVLPSYFEGQSLSLLEAMASYCAVVASETGGIPQMVTEGETGIFAKPKDAASLQEGLLRVLGDKDLCRELGQNARRKIESEFDISSSVEKLLEIYERIVGRKVERD